MKIKSDKLNNLLKKSGISKIVKKLKITRQQILCVAAGAILAVLSTFASENTTVLSDGNTITRSDPGTADTFYELDVGGLTDSKESISVKVSRREYSEEEAYELFDSLMEDLAVYIVGENESLDAVSTDLILPKTVAGYEGISLTWMPEDPDLISEEGTVSNLSLKAPVETSVDLVLKTGSIHKEYTLPLTVTPRNNLTDAELVELLNEEIETADENQKLDGTLILPDTVSGRKINYTEKKNHGSVVLFLLGIVGAVLLGLRPRQEMRKAEKKRESALLLDYSDLVSKLMVYMGAGLTVKNAWIKIANDYRQSVEEGHQQRRPGYDEMLVTAGDFNKGVPERRALTAFAGRCRQKCYLKLVSLLEQNRKVGDGRLEVAMSLEVQEAFEQRKNVAKRLGEEASTKLVMPLILSLMTVMIIAAVPAMMTLM